MENFKLQADYNHALDVMRIGISGKYNLKRTIKIDEGIFIDFNENHLPVNLQINGLSNLIKINKNIQEQMVQVIFNVKKDIINLVVNFDVPENKMSLVKSIVNNHNLPEMDINFVIE